MMTLLSFNPVGKRMGRKDGEPVLEIEDAIRALQTALDGEQLSRWEVDDLVALKALLIGAEDFDEAEFVRPWVEDAVREDAEERDAIHDQHIDELRAEIAELRGKLLEHGIS